MQIIKEETRIIAKMIRELLRKFILTPIKFKQKTASGTIAIDNAKLKAILSNQPIAPEFLFFSLCLLFSSSKGFVLGKNM